MRETATILPPLLRALTVLEFIARHLDPMTFDQMFAAVGAPDDALREAMDSADGDEPEVVSARLALSAFDGMRTALANGDDLYAIYGARGR